MTEPVIGERWTDYPNLLPHGTRSQIIAWLLQAWNPALVVITHQVGPSGTVRFARVVNSGGHLGSDQVLETDVFMRRFRPIPDEPPLPRDIPPEVPR